MNDRFFRLVWHVYQTFVWYQARDTSWVGSLLVWYFKVISSEPLMTSRKGRAEGHSGLLLQLALRQPIASGRRPRLWVLTEYGSWERAENNQLRNIVNSIKLHYSILLWTTYPKNFILPFSFCSFSICRIWTYVNRNITQEKTYYMSYSLLHI